jgi:hypothetical protein
MKWAILTGAALLVVAGVIFVWVAGAAYLAFTNPTGTEFGPFMVLMTLPLTLGAMLAWAGICLLGRRPPM